MFSRYLLRAHTHRTSQPLKKVPPTLSSLTRTYAQQHKPSPNAFRLPPTLTQLVTNPSNHLNGEVEVSGWIKSIRKQKNVAFAVLTDGSSEKGLQAVLVRGEGEEDGDVLRSLTNGAAVRLRGRLVESPGKGQSHELLVERGKEGAVEVLGECDPETYPIQKKLLSNEYLRDNVHLRARTSQNAAMLRLRSGLSRRLGEWFENQGFYAVNTPILTANDAEGAGESFRIAPLPSGHPAASPSPSAPTSSTSPSPSTSPSTSPSHPNPNQQLQEFFTRPAHLTVSHQLHLEAIATGLSRVYTLSPCFRAEPSLTGRHLAEFWMLEAEWAFIQQQHQNGGGVHEVCDVVEAMLRGTVGPLVNPANLNPDVQTLWKSSAASSGKNAALHDKKLSNLQSAFGTNEWWPRMSYTEAITHLESAPRSIKAKWEFEPKWGRPLQSEHERWLVDELVGGGRPVFVTDYPVGVKPFYMRENELREGEGDEGRGTVACFDLLVPGVGELVGGSVREERPEILSRKMREAGLADGGAYKWYEDIRKYGGAPHAGFGMGFERLVSWVGGVENIRECIPFPRWAGRLLL